MTITKPLPWFPLDADEWINRTALLPLEATGALLVAVLAAWNASTRGDEPGTLPASDEAMARLLGPAWARVMPVVREHFVEDPDNPTRLRCKWLIALYAQQLAKHESAAERGRRGGWPKGKPRRKEGRETPAPNSSAIAQLSSSSTERDPRRGAPSEPPIRGGGDASAGRGGATAASPPDEPRHEPPPDPPSLSTETVLAWADGNPALRAAIEREVDAHLDEANRGWRTRPTGVGLRSRLVTAHLSEAYVQARPRVPIPLATQSGAQGAGPGGLHA